MIRFNRAIAKKKKNSIILGLNSVLEGVLMQSAVQQGKRVLAVAITKPQSGGCLGDSTVVHKKLFNKKKKKKR